MPVVRSLATFDARSGLPVERAIFNNRLWIVLACALLTLLLGFQATKLQINAGFEKMIPHGHRLRAQLPGKPRRPARAGQLGARGGREHRRRHLRSGLPGDPQAGQRRAVPDAGRRPRLDEVDLDAGGALERGQRAGLHRRPGDARQLRRLAASVDALKLNIRRANIVGNLVANDFRSSMVFVPLLEKNAEPASRWTTTPSRNGSSSRCAPSTRRPARAT
jgi:hypothetical protein